MAQAPQCFLIKFRDSVWFCGYLIPTDANKIVNNIVSSHHSVGI